jgi:hypothetical protein
MATDRYATGFCFLDGALLAEEVTIDLGYNPNNNIVVTQAKGFAGVSPGAGRFTAKVSNAIPRAGLEVDFYTIAKERRAIELIIHRAAKKLTSKGFIMNLSEKLGVDQVASLEFDFEGEEPEQIA